MYCRGEFSIDGLANLMSVTSLSVYDNTLLESIGLVSLTTMTGLNRRLSISQNPALKDLAGLASLSADVSLRLEDNDALDSHSDIDRMWVEVGKIRKPRLARKDIGHCIAQKVWPEVDWYEQGPISASVWGRPAPVSQTNGFSHHGQNS